MGSRAVNSYLRICLLYMYLKVRKLTDLYKKYLKISRKMFHLVQSCLFKHKTLKIKVFPDEWESGKFVCSPNETIHWVWHIEPFSFLLCFILIFLSFWVLFAYLSQCIVSSWGRNMKAAESNHFKNIIKNVVTQKNAFLWHLGKTAEKDRTVYMMLPANVCHVDKHLLSHWTSFLLFVHLV